MASPSGAFLCAALALALWLSVGWVAAGRLPIDRGMRLAVAPALGWAVQSIVGLALAALFGFSPATVAAATLLACALAGLMRPRPAETGAAGGLPLWALGAAALVAVLPVLGILPKHYPEGIALAGPIYDHSKIAIVDEMIRTGVPPANPFFGAEGQPGAIAYYYFWHFGAAQLGLLAGASGWEADVAATWFTGFAAMMLMSGLAFHLSNGRAPSVVFVLLAACAGSLRPVFDAAFGPAAVAVALNPAELSNWLVQTSWSPHHVQSATATVLALLLMEGLARTPSFGTAIVLGFVAAAGFGSSLWVGGVAAALCGAAVALVLLARIDADRRLRFVAALAAAALAALLLVSPLIVEQLRSAASRGGGAPVAIRPFPVLGSIVADPLRPVLDLPAFWLLLLPVDFPVLWIVGVVAAIRARRAGARAPLHPLARPAAAAILASLCCSWLLFSTVGENNDLGWRAVLPGLLLATPMAGAFVAGRLDGARLWEGAALASVLLVAAATSAGFVRANAAGNPTAEGAAFRDAPAMWAAVGRHASAAERVASNPSMARTMTPWPVNISWALLANRRSCFAGDELAVAFAPLSADRRREASELFERVFAGLGSASDVAALTARYGCRIALVTAEDGAWSADPFGAGTGSRLLEEAPGRWRIYRLSPGPSAPSSKPR